MSHRLREHQTASRDGLRRPTGTLPRDPKEAPKNLLDHALETMVREAGGPQGSNKGLREGEGAEGMTKRSEAADPHQPMCSGRTNGTRLISNENPQSQNPSSHQAARALSPPEPATASAATRVGREGERDGAPPTSGLNQNRRTTQQLRERETNLRPQDRLPRKGTRVPPAVSSTPQRSASKQPTSSAAVAGGGRQGTRLSTDRPSPGEREGQENSGGNLKQGACGVGTGQEGDTVRLKGKAAKMISGEAESFKEIMKVKQLENREENCETISWKSAQDESKRRLEELLKWRHSEEKPGREWLEEMRGRLTTFQTDFPHMWEAFEAKYWVEFFSNNTDGMSAAIDAMMNLLFMPTSDVKPHGRSFKLHELRFANRELQWKKAELSKKLGEQPDRYLRYLCLAANCTFRGTSNAGPSFVVSPPVDDTISREWGTAILHVQAVIDLAKFVYRQNEFSLSLEAYLEAVRRSPNNLEALDGAAGVAMELHMQEKNKPREMATKRTRGQVTAGSQQKTDKTTGSAGPSAEVPTVSVTLHDSRGTGVDRERAKMTAEGAAGDETYFARLALQYRQKCLEVDPTSVREARKMIELRDWLGHKNSREEAAVHCAQVMREEWVEMTREAQEIAKKILGLDPESASERRGALLGKTKRAAWCELLKACNLTFPILLELEKISLLDALLSPLSIQSLSVLVPPRTNASKCTQVAHYRYRWMQKAGRKEEELLQWTKEVRDLFVSKGCTVPQWAQSCKDAEKKAAETEAQTSKEKVKESGVKTKSAHTAKKSSAEDEKSRQPQTAKRRSPPPAGMKAPEKNRKSPSPSPQRAPQTSPQTPAAASGHRTTCPSPPQPPAQASENRQPQQPPSSDSLSSLEQRQIPPPSALPLSPRFIQQQVPFPAQRPHAPTHIPPPMQVQMQMTLMGPRPCAVSPPMQPPTNPLSPPMSFAPAPRGPPPNPHMWPYPPGMHPMHPPAFSPQMPPHSHYQQQMQQHQQSPHVHGGFFGHRPQSPWAQVPGHNPALRRQAMQPQPSQQHQEPQMEKPVQATVSSQKQEQDKDLDEGNRPLPHAPPVPVPKTSSFHFHFQDNRRRASPPHANVIAQQQQQDLPRHPARSSSPYAPVPISEPISSLSPPHKPSHQDPRSDLSPPHQRQWIAARHSPPPQEAEHDRRQWLAPPQSLSPPSHPPLNIARGSPHRPYASPVHPQSPPAGYAMPSHARQPDAAASPKPFGQYPQRLSPPLPFSPRPPISPPPNEGVLEKGVQRNRQSIPFQSPPNHNIWPQPTSPPPAVEAPAAAIVEAAAPRAASPVLVRPDIELDDEEQIKTADLWYDQRLGAGGFGAVFKGALKGKLVAIKKLHLDIGAGPSTKEEDLNRVMHELKVEVSSLRKLRHKRLVKFVGACLDSPHICIVTELCEGGSLHDVLHVRRMRLSWLQACRIGRHMAEGVEYLHSRTPVVVHRDMKAMNVVLDLSLGAKLCDFGLTHAMEKTHISRQDAAPGGSPRYMAPELWEAGSRLTEKVDIWALGCILIETFGEKAAEKHDKKIATLTYDEILSFVERKVETAELLAVKVAIEGQGSRSSSSRPHHEYGAAASGLRGGSGKGKGGKEKKGKKRETSFQSSGDRDRNAGTAAASSQGGSSLSSRPCPNCGHLKHYDEAKGCPAKNVRCSVPGCNQTGHYAKCCPLKKQKQQQAAAAGVRVQKGTMFELRETGNIPILRLAKVEEAVVAANVCPSVSPCPLRQSALSGQAEISPENRSHLLFVLHSRLGHATGQRLEATLKEKGVGVQFFVKECKEVRDTYKACHVVNFRRRKLKRRGAAAGTRKRSRKGDESSVHEDDEEKEPEPAGLGGQFNADIYHDLKDMKRKGIGGFRYVSVIVDLQTRRKSLWALRSKDHAVRHLISWTRRWEKAGKGKPKVVHSDNGGEFISDLYLSFCL
uniref:Protein kinase domain-containing protein n=1 Tax=Chromera velia CCMP2878 TaxID=1169474 RepID=A0A0G4H0T1_9ALVE|eukprot:Cvel_24242.t1-p1 / transcript=Cvel_24242.t1 / gene=Cvel_24242 / organism=Chromera_velia_CCMP2878 / gene_product=Probable serine/threonine-protein kinase, putative / transcript_product=Probable serine/threonine-protein kinase, putative / location=Cvel_scaffold2596:3785-18037(+) / protein_length=1923 / sequence_SO=supercontig / SO=protein_coding / is_pseudo=false